MSEPIEARTSDPPPGTRSEPVTVLVLSDPRDPPWPGLDPPPDGVRLLRATTDADLADRIGAADVLLVTDFRTQALQRHFARASRLRWIHATSAGVDPLMFPELVGSDVPVTHAHGVFDADIAEYVLGLLLAFAKDLPTTLAHQRDARWQHRDAERLAGTQVLVVGAGSIGRAVGRLCRAAGLHVTGIASRSRPADDVFARIDGPDALHPHLADADWVVVTAPLTDQTRGMIDAPALRAMRPGARLINVGRGAIVNTHALVDALRQNTIAGAALDVVDPEPLPPDHPLWTLPNVILSPHMSGDVHGWRERLSTHFLTQLDHWRRGEPLSPLVDKRRFAARG